MKYIKQTNPCALAKTNYKDKK